MLTPYENGRKQQNISSLPSNLWPKFSFAILLSIAWALQLAYKSDVSSPLAWNYNILPLLFQKDCPQQHENFKNAFLLQSTHIFSATY